MELSKLIKAHHFDRVNAHITEGVATFDDQPVREQDQSKYTLVELKADTLSYEKVLDALLRTGVTPANIYELLSWEGWDNKSMVVALGSQTVVEDVAYVPCITLEHIMEPGRYHTERRLSLLSVHKNWTGEMFFLGFKNT